MDIEESAKISLVDAIQYGRLDDAKELIPRCNLSQQEQFYCLFHALFYDQQAIVSFLRENGFELVSRGEKSCPTVFRLPVFNPNIELIDMLLKQPVFDPTCSVSPLLFLAFRGRANQKFVLFFESLLSKADDTDIEALLNSSLTHVTPEDTQPAIPLRTFLAYDSAVIKLADFSALLYLAISRGNEKIVKLLLSRICIDDLMDLLEAVLVDTAFDDWRPLLFQALLDYGSTDMQIVTEDYVRPLFEILNRCVVLNPHVHLISNCTLGRVFNEKDVSATEILVQHAMKMKVADLYKERLVVVIFNDPETVCDYQRKCEAEVEEMQSENIGESNVTFYDVLTRDLNGLALLGDNEQIGQFLRTNYCKVKFPIYSNMISSQYEKGGVRKTLLEKSIKICHPLLGHFSHLPIELVEKVFSYLNNKELRIVLYPRKYVSKDDP